jgi:hypothetical protein
MVSKMVKKVLQFLGKLAKEEALSPLNLCLDEAAPALEISPPGLL